MTNSVRPLANTPSTRPVRAIHGHKPHKRACHPHRETRSSRGAHSPLRPPGRTAASPCRTFARCIRPHRDDTRACGKSCGHSMTHWNLLPVRRGTSDARPPLSRWLHFRAPSPTPLVGQHCGKIPEPRAICLRFIWVLPVLNQAAGGDSFTDFSISNIGKLSIP